MPNWCYNNTDIQFKQNASEVKIQDFISKLIVKRSNDTSMDLLNLVPLNPDKTWDYNKAIEMWGSKWEPVSLSSTYDPKTKLLNLWYDTAWDPINNALITIAKNHPDLIDSIENQYEELGAGFMGKLSVNNLGDHFDVTGESYDVITPDFEIEDLKELYRLRKHLPEDLCDFKDLLNSYKSFKTIEEEVTQEFDDDVREWLINNDVDYHVEVYLTMNQIEPEELPKHIKELSKEDENSL